MDEHISRQFEANKDKPNMPKLVGLVPSPKKNLH